MDLGQPITPFAGRAGEWEKVCSGEEIELYPGQKLELLRTTKREGLDRLAKNQVRPQAELGGET